jgi:hypothetical protein
VSDRVRISAFVAVLSLVAGVGIGALVWSGGGEGDTGGDVLLVQSGSAGRLEHLESTRYRLILTPEASTFAFTDRPQRRVLTFPSVTTPDRWSQGGFTASPPNAALVVDASRSARPNESRPHTFIFELTNPSYRSPRGDLAYDARLLRADAALPHGFGEASLFIDGADAGIVGSDATEPGIDANARTPISPRTLQALKDFRAQIPQIRGQLPAQQLPTLTKAENEIQELLLPINDPQAGGTVNLAVMFALQFHMQIMAQSGAFPTVSTALQALNQQLAAAVDGGSD